MVVVFWKIFLEDGFYKFVGFVNDFVDLLCLRLVEVDGNL